MQSATLKQPVDIRGDGLFTGAPCRAELRPAAPGSGIVFIKDGVRVPALPEHYADSPNCSVLVHGRARIVQTEHLLAALWTAGIDTVEIEVEGPELPNHDGSARLLYSALTAGGRVELGPKPPLPELDAIELKGLGGGALAYRASPLFYVEYLFSHPELGQQHFAGQLTRQWVAEQILPARTFITGAEARVLTDEGVLQHDDESAALVIHGGRPGQPLRFADEYARHKVLDLLGDLAVVPYELSGFIVATASGHELNREMARRLAEAARG